MTGPDLAETAVLYALSALAQSCAALIAFLGAVALYRLQNLTNERVGLVDRMVMLWTGGDMISRGYSEDQVVGGVASAVAGPPNCSNHQRLSQLLQEYHDVLDEIRLAQWLLLRFVVVNIAVVFFSFLGFPLVRFLSAHPVTATLILAGSIGAVCLSTLVIVLELTGSLPYCLRVRLEGHLKILSLPERLRKEIFAGERG